MKTTLSLPNPLHQRLLQVSKAEHKSLTGLIHELLDNALAGRERKQIEQTYQTLDKLIGIGQDEDPHRPSSVDDVLYGEDGAWKGAHE